MTLKYLDTGLNGSSDCAGLWLESQLADHITVMRGQFGYFDTGIMLPVIHRIKEIEENSVFRFVLGANPGNPLLASDIAEIHENIRSSDESSLTIVAMKNGLFHPKCMHITKRDGSKVGLVGSANFTRFGFYQSIESSIVLTQGEATNEILAQMLTSIDRWRGLDSEGVFQIAGDDDIAELVENGLAVTEEAKAAIVRAQSRIKVTSTGRGSLQTARPGIALGRGSEAEAKNEQASNEIAATADEEITDEDYEILWQSKPLTRRDLTIPDRPGSHPTGSINLDKGLLDDAVDHRHYFRDSVFNQLAWETTKTPTVDATHATFQLVIDGANVGNFTLRIAHTTSTDTASYRQRNAMTRLSWGEAKEYVAQEGLIDGTMSLARSTKDASAFQIIITSP